MTIVFIGTPAFAVPSLRRLVAAGHEIAAVVTQPDRPSGRGRRSAPPPIKIAAEELGLTVLQPKTLRNRNAVSEIEAMQPDVIVAVAYGQILRPNLLAIAPKGVLNVHPSLLPRWRGPSPIAAAILAGDQETGVTIMLMDPGMDSGPLLAQRHVMISPVDTTGTLTERLAEEGAGLLAGTLPLWLGGEIEPRPQDESAATASRLIKKDDAAIDWSRAAEEAWRQVRAYNPWPGAYSALNGGLLHVWQAWPLPDGGPEDPGTVLPLTQDQADAVPQELPRPALGVKTGEGMLALVEVQRAGRRKMTSAEFARGMPEIAGKRLVTPPRVQPSETP